jgi:hypothetical protein
MLLPILGVVVLVIAGLLRYTASRPDSFVVQRSTHVAAPPERILPLIDDFHAWASWSPYEKLDPGMKRTYSGALRGVGAVYEWDGNSKAGAGRMEIKRADTSRVSTQLDFTRPFRANNAADFIFEPQADGTRVTWSMTGTNAFMTKLFGVFVNMDRLIGRDFEAGLASLKSLAEQASISQG